MRSFGMANLRLILTDGEAVLRRTGGDSSVPSKIRFSASQGLVFSRRCFMEEKTQARKDLALQDLADSPVVRSLGCAPESTFGNQSQS
jgi:hypothetical protein